MFFNCYDKQVIEECFEMTNAFRRREYAEVIAKGQRERESHKMLWEKNDPIRKVSVEGFYLVHESLFEEILEKFAKDY